MAHIAEIPIFTITFRKRGIYRCWGGNKTNAYSSAFTQIREVPQFILNENRKKRKSTNV